MARPRKQPVSGSEFPILHANALYAGEIRGDGNCLFNALSDQLYGTQEMHDVLRAITIEHMKENADFYRQYMAVNTVRRNPKRKAAVASYTRIDPSHYTEEELQKRFEAHVDKMGQPGEWADNMEVSAFASALNVHVRLWQADCTYLISPRVYYVSDDPDAVDDRQTLHIAYHNWEHYSSVRSSAGPHTGKPEVHVAPQYTTMRKRPSPSIEDDEDVDDIPRARKRRSPVVLSDSDSDSDSMPDSNGTSSDESSGVSSSQSHLDLSHAEAVGETQKLTIKLRLLKPNGSIEPPTAIPLPAFIPMQLPTPPPSVSDGSASADCPSDEMVIPASCMEGSR